MLGIVAAAKKVGLTKQSLLKAVRRGQLPAIAVQVLELRFKPKDVVAYAATVQEWRQKAGRKGAHAKWRNYRARKAATSARSPASQAS